MGIDHLACVSPEFSRETNLTPDQNGGGVWWFVLFSLGLLDCNLSLVDPQKKALGCLTGKTEFHRPVDFPYHWIVDQPGGNEACLA